MLKGIFYLGIKFFLLQLSGILLFSTSNIIISHYIDPLSVTPYQVAQRYFNIILVLFTIIVVPLWSATTDAYARKDYEWIKMCGRKGRQLMLVILPILIVMSLVAPYIYSLWTLDKVTVSPSMTLTVCENFCALRIKDPPSSSLISKCSYAMATNDQRVVLNGCYFKVTTDNLLAVACDSFKLAQAPRGPAPQSGARDPPAP